MNPKNKLPDGFESALPNKPISIEKLPFFVSILSPVGILLLVFSILAELGLVVAAVDRSNGDKTPYGWYGIAVILQGVVVCGLLQAVEHAVRLLHKIAKNK